MSARTRMIVGGTAADDGAAFLDAWQHAERGEDRTERVVSFESWEGLSSVITGERISLLRHLHATPHPSVGSLAQALQRNEGEVASDLVALENAGLVERSGGGLRVTSDAIATEIRL